ncbi:MAG: hypothetical protein WA715_28555 [Candidatus Acidiferrum sp.]|jgi:hypothetical protein
MGTSSRNLKQRAYRELKEFLVIAVYLWVVFGVLIVHTSLVLGEHHIDFKYHGLALINALALAKVMLVAKDMHLGERLNEAPLIYPTLLKSALFTVVLACFKMLEEVGIGLYRRESFQQSIADLGGGTWKGILTLTVLLFVVLTPFVAFGELQRVLGEGKLGLIFFHPRPFENQLSKS